MPYNFGDNWLHDASPEDQRRLQDATVDVIAELHAIPDAATTFAFLDPTSHGDTRAGAQPRPRPQPGTTSPSPTSAARRSSSAALAWLEANLPDNDGGRALLGRLPHRQRDVPRLRAGRRPRLGDGRDRPARARRVVDRLRPPGLRVDHRHASRCPACRTSCARRTSWRRTTRSPARQLGDLHWYHVYNAHPVVHRLHAHRRPADPLRRDRAARRHRVALPPQAADGALLGRG